MTFRRASQIPAITSETMRYSATATVCGPDSVQPWSGPVKKLAAASAESAVAKRPALRPDATLTRMTAGR